jgi:hypothetical protein
VAVELHLCGDFLLAAVPIYPSIYHGGEECERKSVRKAGIYIFYRSSLELMNHDAGSYIYIKSAENGDVVAETVGGRFKVHQLVFSTSFHRRFPQNDQNDYRDNPWILRRYKGSRSCLSCSLACYRFVRRHMIRINLY